MMYGNYPRPAWAGGVEVKAGLRGRGFPSAPEKQDKGVRRMPRLSEARKDVTSCEKPRGGAGGL